MSEPDQSAGAEAAPASAGALLRAARQRQGVHLAVLAASLKVAPRKLELIEADRFDELPDPTFARALALSMCRALKVDPQAVLERLPQPRDERLDGLARSYNRPLRKLQPGEWAGGAETRSLSLPVLAAVLLVAAAVVVYLLPARLWQRDSEVTPALLPASAAAAAASAPPEEPSPPAPSVAVAPTMPAAASAASSPADAATDAALAGADAALAGLAASAPPAVASAPAAASAPGDAAIAGVLKLHASKPSWIEVRDAHGAVLLSRTLGADESVALDGTPPLRVTVGNARDTQLVFRGQPVSLAPSTTGNVARLELK